MEMHAQTSVDPRDLGVGEPFPHQPLTPDQLQKVPSKSILKSSSRYACKEVSNGHLAGDGAGEASPVITA